MQVNLTHPIIIAIDGPSSSGKSTFAKAVAAALGYRYIDSGAMYRALTLYALRSHLVNPSGKVDAKGLVAALPAISITFRVNDVSGKNETFLNGENVENEIRRMDVSAAVSQISEIAEARTFLTAQQRALGAGRGVVMDGRDIGAVVFPDAELKVFLTASPQVRAKRRYDEMIAKGETADYEAVLNNIAQRDYIDEHRSAAPLQLVPDALLLNNSTMTIDEQVNWIMKRLAALQSGSLHIKENVLPLE